MDEDSPNFHDNKHSNNLITNYDGQKFEINDGKGSTIVGVSDSMLDLFQLANTLSIIPQTPVLITGEKGTGKGLLASAIHYSSNTKNGTLIHKRSAVLSEASLEESFKKAKNGTLFLDRIDQLKIDQQQQLIDLIEGGDQKPRIIASTNEPLEEQVSKLKFEEDLLYLLNVSSIIIPPLRERKEDIVPLSDFYISQFNQLYSTSINGLDDSAREFLQNQEFKKANGRELKNLIQNAFNLRRSGFFSKEYFSKNEPFFQSGIPSREYFNPKTNQYEFSESKVSISEVETVLEEKTQQEVVGQYIENKSSLTQEDEGLILEQESDLEEKIDFNKPQENIPKKAGKRTGRPSKYGNTEEDIKSFYDKNLAGLTSSEVQENMPGFYNRARTLGLLHIFPKKDRRKPKTNNSNQPLEEIVGTKKTGKRAGRPSKYGNNEEELKSFYNENTPGLTSSEVLEKIPSFYQRASKLGLLHIFPKKDRRKPKTNNSNQPLEEIVGIKKTGKRAGRPSKYGNNEEEIRAFYEKHTPGLTSSEVQKKMPGLYQRAWNLDLLHVFPKKEGRSSNKGNGNQSLEKIVGTKRKRIKKINDQKVYTSTEGSDNLEPGSIPEFQSRYDLNDFWLMDLLSEEEKVEFQDELLVQEKQVYDSELNGQRIELPDFVYLCENFWSDELSLSVLANMDKNRFQKISKKAKKFIPKNSGLTDYISSSEVHPFATEEQISYVKKLTDTWFTDLLSEGLRSELFNEVMLETRRVKIHHNSSSKKNLTYICETYKDKKLSSRILAKDSPKIQRDLSDNDQVRFLPDAKVIDQIISEHGEGYFEKVAKEKGDKYLQNQESNLEKELVAIEPEKQPTQVQYQNLPKKDKPSPKREKSLPKEEGLSKKELLKAIQKKKSQEEIFEEEISEEGISPLEQELKLPEVKQLTFKGSSGDFLDDTTRDPDLRRYLSEYEGLPVSGYLSKIDRELAINLKRKGFTKDGTIPNFRSDSRLSGNLVDHFYENHLQQFPLSSKKTLEQEDRALYEMLRIDGGLSEIIHEPEFGSFLELYQKKFSDVPGFILEKVAPSVYHGLIEEGNSDWMPVTIEESRFKGGSETYFNENCDPGLSEDGLRKKDNGLLVMLAYEGKDHLFKKKSLPS